MVETLKKERIDEFNIAEAMTALATLQGAVVEKQIEAWQYRDDNQTRKARSREETVGRRREKFERKRFEVLAYSKSANDGKELVVEVPEEAPPLTVGEKRRVGDLAIKPIVPPASVVGRLVAIESDFSFVLQNRDGQHFGIRPIGPNGQLCVSFGVKSN